MFKPKLKLTKRAISVVFATTSRLLPVGVLLFFALFAAFAQQIQSPEPVQAQAATLNFQARLLRSTGTIVPDGDYNVEFKLFNHPTATTEAQGVCTTNCLWVETRTGGNRVTVKNGYLSVYLGDVTSLPTAVDWDQQLYLTMNIGGTGSPAWDGEMAPRIRLTAVPNAFNAYNVQGQSTNAASTNSSNVTIRSGNAAGSSSNSGNVIIDVGTATGTAGSISIGTSNTSGVTIGRATVNTTLQGNILVSTLGTASNDTVVCRNGSNQLATCNSTFLTTGDLNVSNVFLQGGNSFTAAAVLGTNDDYGLNLRTNGVTRLAISNTGATTITGGTTGNPDALTVNNSTSTGNILNLQDNGTNVMTVADGGAVTFQNTTNSTSALRVLNAAGSTTVLSVDTTNNRVGIGTATPTQALQVVGNALFSGNVAVGPGNTIGSCGIYGDCGAMYSAVRTSTSTTDDIQVGSYNELNLNPASTPDVSPTSIYGIGSISLVTVASGNSTNINTALIGGIAQILHLGTGTLSNVQGSNSTIINSSTGQIGSGFGGGSIAVNAGISNDSSGVFGAITNGVNSSITNASTGSINDARGLNTTINNASTGTITIARGINVDVGNNSTGTMTTAQGAEILVRNSGTMTDARGADIVVRHSGTGTLTTAIGSRIRVENTSTGTITTANGIRVRAATNSGGGSITQNTGIRVEAQTVGDTNYGIRIDGVEDASEGFKFSRALLLAGTSGTLIDGIGFGTLEATALYRTGNLALRTNSSFRAEGLLQGDAGATISGAATSINASSNFATNINTGTSTGTVTIGGTGTQTISIGNGAGVKTVNLGSSNTTSTTTLLSGSGGLNLNVSNNQATNINTGTSTGAVSIGNASCWQH
jgi:trimeric autotransporter adhesin